MGLLIFSLVAFILVVSAIVVVAHPNPVFSALALALNLTFISFIYGGLDANFLAVSQIIVYAGAIIVLLLFVLMLLNVKHETSDRSDFGILTIAIAVGAGLLAYITPILRHGFERGGWSDVVGSVKGLGILLFTEYLYPLQLAGVLLVSAIVGAVLLATQRKGKI